VSFDRRKIGPGRRLGEVPDGYVGEWVADIGGAGEELVVKGLSPLPMEGAIPEAVGSVQDRLPEEPMSGLDGRPAARALPLFLLGQKTGWARE
jgi:hypothetical protein